MMGEKKIYRTREGWFVLTFKKRAPEPSWVCDTRSYWVGMAYADQSYREGFSTLHNSDGKNTCMAGVFDINWSIPPTGAPDLWRDTGISYMSGGKRWEE